MAMITVTTEIPLPTQEWLTQGINKRALTTEQEQGITMRVGRSVVPVMATRFAKPNVLRSCNKERSL